MWIYICERWGLYKKKSWIKLHLSNGILTLQCVMAIVHLGDWIIHRANQSPHLKKLTASPPLTYGNRLRTVHATWLHREINPRLSLLHGDIAVAADKHYLVCDHVCTVSSPTPPPSFKISQSGAGCVDTVGCHTVSSVGVSVASIAVTSQKTQGNVSLLTSSVCLAACLIAGACTAKGSTGSVGAHAADKPNPPLASPKQTCIYSMFVAFHSAHTHTHISFCSVTSIISLCCLSWISLQLWTQ